MRSYGWAWLVGYMLLGLLTARGLYMWSLWHNDRCEPRDQVSDLPHEMAPLLFLATILWWIVWAFAVLAALFNAVVWLATAGVRRSS